MFVLRTCYVASAQHICERTGWPGLQVWVGDHLRTSLGARPIFSWHVPWRSCYNRNCPQDFARQSSHQRTNLQSHYAPASVLSAGPRPVRFFQEDHAGLKDRARVLIGPLTMAASLMLFWTVAHEAWIWGIASVQYFLSILWAVLSVWALSRWPGRWAGVVIASVATTFAIFTSGCGFALIAVGLLGLLGNGIAQGRIRWLQLLVFFLASASCVAAFFIGHSWVSYSATLVEGLHPVEMVSYFVSYVGSPFWIRTAGYRSSQLFGCVGIVSMGAPQYTT